MILRDDCLRENVMRWGGVRWTYHVMILGMEMAGKIHAANFAQVLDMTLEKAVGWT